MSCRHGFSSCLDSLQSSLGVLGGSAPKDLGQHVWERWRGSPWQHAAGTHRMQIPATCYELRKALEHLHLLMKHALDLIKWKIMWTLPTGYLTQQQMLRMSKILLSRKPLWTSGSFSLNLNEPWLMPFHLSSEVIFLNDRIILVALLWAVHEEEGLQLSCQGSAAYSSWATCSLPLVF